MRFGKVAGKRERGAADPVARRVIRSAAMGLLVLAGLGGCGVPAMDGSTLEGRAAVLDAVYKALTAEDCTRAISLIEGSYNSVYSENEIRMARAAAQACNAGFTNFFKFMGQVPSEQWGTAAAQGSYMFRTAAKLFYNSDSNELATRIDSGRAAIEALQATLKPGGYVSSGNRVTSNDYNTGSVLASDRTDDSNLYMVLMGLTTMGAIENKYGLPSTSTWKKGQALGYNGSTSWEVYTRIDDDACLYVASLLNMIDAYSEVSGKLSPALQAAFGPIALLESALDTACAAGCNNVNPTGSGSASGCQDSGALCTACPLKLRDPSSCTATANLQLGKKNPYACAAAGMINYINNSTVAGWVGP